MASLWPQWLRCEPLPPTMVPFKPPPRVIAPSLTACVRRAPDTKEVFPGSVNTLLPFIREGTKANPPFTSGRTEAGLCHLYQNANLYGGGGGVGDHIVFQDHSAKKVPDYFYLQRHYICIKIGFFCPLRRTKRKLSQESQRGTQEGKGRKRFPKTNKVSRWTLNYTLESLLGK